MKSRMKDTLLLIGDADSDRSNLQSIFESSYNLLEAEDAAQGILLLEQNRTCIVAVVVDIPLIQGDALRSLVQACHQEGEDEIPIVCLVTPTGTGQREETAFLLGVADVVQKPYTDLSIRRRIQILAELYMHQWHLEKLVEDQSKAIRNTNQSMVDTLSAIIEHRSTESGNHVLRIRRFTQLLLQEIARCYPEYHLDEATIDKISTASALHDIGKISIPDNILNKPGKLTSEEFEIMKTHTIVGGQLAEQIGDIGDPMYLRYIYNICLFHHERWDGSGYPRGLKGNDIPLCAHVVGLVDAYDALTSPRIYKPAFSHEKSVNMILNGECGAFSPRLLECFKRVRPDFEHLAHLYSDGYSPKSDQIRIPLPGPAKELHSLNALQLSQLKYQTVLHYIHDTVIELDVDNRNYHVVYNPDPDFVSLFANASFEELSLRLMQDGAHPAGLQEIGQMQQVFREKLFQQGQRKCSFRCNIFSHLYGDYFPYEITLLRVNTSMPNQRIVLAIFHNLEQKSDAPMRQQKYLPDTAMFYELTDGAVRCGMDEALTIELGGGTLLPLTGYSEADLQTLFGNSLLKLFHPDDRARLRASLDSYATHAGTVTGQYRILCKTGEPVWVLCKSRAAVDADGRELCYHLFIDISSEKTQETQFARKVSLHTSLVDLSEGVIFEWNPDTGELICSQRWQERFGYPCQPQLQCPQLSNATHLHPDDMPDLRKKLLKILNSEEPDFADVRIANSDGRYLWSRIRARCLRDGSNTRIIGIIYDINELKSDALSMLRQAQLDGLTKLLNKSFTEQSVSHYLSSREDNASAAMLILDLDNFKVVNDTFGHLYGDAVLTQIGTTLNSLFRSQDIIGRIGGDEFLILLKNITSQEAVIDRCQLLVDTFREQLQRLMPNQQVSVSVGAAIAPVHGTTYTELFQHADEALYTAKRLGKCRFHLYRPQDTYGALVESISHTRIDSDDQPAINTESMMRLVFHRLYESRDVEATINEVLAFIGTHFNVSRVYIFENNRENTTCSNTFEWCNQGIEPQKDFLQDLNYEEDLPGWKEVYEPTGVLYCSDVSELAPHIRAIVEPQGIKSMLHCAIKDRGVFRGYVGFDECTANYLWTQGQISTLQFLAEVLAVFLIKQRASGNQ